MDDSIVSVPFSVEVLSPYHYHGMLTTTGPIGGTATHAGYLTDMSICFALAGLFPSLLPRGERLRRGRMSYKEDLRGLPWRSTLCVGKRNTTLPRQIRKVDLFREGGDYKSITKNTGEGNYKSAWTVIEVAPGAEFAGLLVFRSKEDNPFYLFDVNELCVRVGTGLNGLLKIKKDPEDSLKAGKEEKEKKKEKEKYVLNRSTALLFGDNDLVLRDFVLDNIQATEPLPKKDVVKHLTKWLES